MTDEAGDLKLEQLEELRADVGGLRSDVGGLRTEVGGLRAEIGELRVEVRGTNDRLDHTGLRLDRVETALRDLAMQMVILGRFVRRLDG